MVRSSRVLRILHRSGDHRAARQFWAEIRSGKNSPQEGDHQANTFLTSGGSLYFNVNEGEKGDSVVIGIPHVPQATLAAEILALVVTAQPSETRPLTVTVRLEEYGLAKYPAFRSAPGWKETRHNAHNIMLDCEFVWDADARKLTKGSVPLLEMNATGDFISLIGSQLGK